MESFKEYFKDFLEYIPSTAVPIIVSLISVPLFTKYLSPEEWGDYILILNGSELLTTVCIAWLSASIIRFYEEKINEHKEEELISTTLVYGLIILLVISSLIISITFFFGNNISQSYGFSLVLIGLWLFLVYSINNLFGSLFKAQRKARKYSALVSWQNMSKLVFGLLFVGLLNNGVKGLLIGTAIGFTSGVAFFGIRIITHLNLKMISYSLIKKLFLYGFPIVAGDVAFWFLRLSDRYILRLFRSAYEVGIYSVSYDLSDRSLGALISLLAISSWPLVVQTWERKGKAKTSEFLTQLMRFYLLLCVPATIAISILRKPIMEIMADQQYFIGNSIIPLVVFSVFLFGFQRWFQLILALFKKTYLIMLSVVCGAILSIILNLVFVPKYGYIASAIINIFGYLIFTLLVIVFSRSLMVWRFPYSSLRNSIMASLAMALSVIAVLTFIQKSILIIIISVPIGLIIYTSTLFFLNEFSFKVAINSIRNFLNR